MAVLLYIIAGTCIVIGAVGILLVPLLWIGAGSLILAGVLWLAMGRIVECLERLAFPREILRLAGRKRTRATANAQAQDGRQRRAEAQRVASGMT
jgi:hypothetical protein